MDDTQRPRPTGRFRTCSRPRRLESSATDNNLHDPCSSAPSIFKAYDVRGIVPATLTEEVAQALGRAFGTAARRQGEQTVAVGRDGRLSGPRCPPRSRGLVASGVDVIDTSAW